MIHHKIADGPHSDFADDIVRTAWFIAAKHLTAGQKDVTKMIAEGIRQERVRCMDIMEAALGPDAQRAVFLADPNCDW